MLRVLTNRRLSFTLAFYFLNGLLSNSLDTRSHFKGFFRHPHENIDGKTHRE